MKNIRFPMIFTACGLVAGLLAPASSQATSATMDKIKSSGAVTMGVRESSIPMS